MSSAPKSLTRAEAMTLLTAAGKHTPEQLAKMEQLDDDMFDMFMPLATSLMKKTKAPAKAALTEEQKAKIVYDKKIAYLQSLATEEGKQSSSKVVGEHLELLPKIKGVFYTPEEIEAMGKVAVKKLPKCSITKNYIKKEDTNEEEYMASVKEYQFVLKQIQNAAYSLLLEDIAKKPNRFLAGNMKVNAAGKLEKLGGKQEKTADELEGEITITNAHGKVEKKTLQKNEPVSSTAHRIKITEEKQEVNDLYRMKNCGNGSTQTAICEYTTPYNPVEVREGGCPCIVYMKDVGEFMVNKTAPNTYVKIPQSEALTCMPCFRVCNRDIKDGSGKCGTHLRHTEPSAKIKKIAEEVNFPMGDGVWGEAQADWYNDF